MTPELVEEYFERLRVEGAARGYYGVTAPAPSDGDRVELAEISRPTLVVWGEEDTLIPVEKGRTASRQIPCHRFVTVPGAGHMPMEERPDEVVAALRSFLSRPEAVCGGLGRVP